MIQLRDALLSEAARARGPELAEWNASPAEAALAPLLWAAGALLEEELDGCGVPLLPSARGDLVRILSPRLTWSCLPLLAHERAALEATAPAGSLAGPLDSSVASWRERFALYPALAVLVERVVLGWRAHVRELLGRLRQDWELLGAPAALAEVRGDAGDVHAGGRAVAVLRFEGGRGVVYKPKDLRITRAVLELCGFLNSAGLPLPLHVRQVLPRGEYTWEELVEAAPCRTRGEVERFHVRMGMLLRLFQLLEARDLGCDNLVAAGEHPVFIDLEVTLQPRRARGSPAAEQLLESVAPIGILAELTPSAPGFPAEDMGALTPPHAFLTPLRWSPTFAALAGPRRASQHGYLSWPPPEHAPVLDGEPARAVDFLEPLLEGYRGMHAALRANRARLLAPDGPLERMAGLPVRYLHRDTWSYYRLSLASLSPRLLSSPEQRDAALSGLVREESGPERAAAHVEVEALRGQDVPYFLCSTSGSALLGPDGRVLQEEFFEGTGMERARERVRELEAFPLPRHEDVVRSVLGTGRHQLPPRTEGGEEDGPVDWLARAVELGDFILGEAIATGDGLEWLGVTYDPVYDLWDLGVLRPDLLTGSSGIAVVLAELHAASGLERFRSAAWAALGATRAAMRQAPAPGAAGAFVGAGAHLYTLHRCAAALNAPELASEARAYAEALSLEVLCREAALDVATGLTGLLLALIACEAEGPARVVEAALERRLAAGAPPSRPLPHDLPGLEEALALCAARMKEAPSIEPLGAEERQARSALTRRRQSGRWFPDRLSADRHELSALWGVPALAHLFLRLHHPGRWPPLRTVPPLTARRGP